MLTQCPNFNRLSLCAVCGETSDFNQGETNCLPVGTILRNQQRLFCVGSVLGQGGFGITYRGFDLGSGSPVAIKEYFPSQFSIRDIQSKQVFPYSDEENRSRFVFGLDKFTQEADTLFKLNDNPHIVQITDTFESNGTSYIVMQLLKGTTLEKLINQKINATFSEIWNWMRPVAQALDQAHQVNLLHRDVKPDNIYVTGGKDNLPHLVLYDFGAVKSLVSSKDSMFAFFSLPYSPVEQLSTVRKDLHNQFIKTNLQGPWTDIYAFAATLSHLLTGKKPPDVIERQMNADDPYFSYLTTGTDLNEAQKQTLLKAMAVSPENRFQTFHEFIHALDGSISEHPSTFLLLDKLIQQAKAYENSKQQQQALKLWEQVLAISPKHPEALKHSEMLQKEAEIKTLINQSKDALLQKQFETAQSTVEKAQQLDVHQIFQEDIKKLQQDIRKMIPQRPLLHRKKLLMGLSALTLIGAGCFIVWKVVFSDPFVNMVLMRNGQYTKYDFYIDQYEVSNQSFLKFVRAMPEWQKSNIAQDFHDGGYLRLWKGNLTFRPDRTNHPVVYVSWYAAKAYCAWSNKRLPSVGEWNQAAGTKRWKYPWGNDNPSNQLANYNSDFTQPVGSYPPSRHQLYDLAGNVSEWTTSSDIFKTEYKIVKGGRWRDNMEKLKNDDFTLAKPKLTHSAVGFRCAANIP